MSVFQYVTNGSISGYVDIYDENEMILSDGTHRIIEDHPCFDAAYEKLKRLGYSLSLTEDANLPTVYGDVVINLNTGQHKEPSTVAYFSDFRGHNWS